MDSSGPELGPMVADSSERSNEPSGSIRGVEFFD